MLAYSMLKIYHSSGSSAGHERDRSGRNQSVSTTIIHFDGRTKVATIELDMPLLLGAEY